MLTSVDQTETVSLARGQADHGILSITSGRVDVGTVDKDIVTSWWPSALCQDDNLVRSLVVVVSQEKRTKVDIVVETGWAVDLDGPNDTIAVLSREVRVYHNRLEICE